MRSKRDEPKDPMAEAMRSLKEEDLRRGVSPDERITCTRCHGSRMAAGSKTFGEIILCNDCLLVYARACFASPGLAPAVFVAKPIPEGERRIDAPEVPEDQNRVSRGASSGLAGTEDVQARIEAIESQLAEIWGLLDRIVEKNPKWFK